MQAMLPQQGMFSKASRDPSALERTQIESQMLKQQFENGIDGPWYPGSKMDTHRSRVKYTSKKSKKNLDKMGLSGSVERNRSKSKLAGPAKFLSPEYMTQHLNSVKAKNRRNSGAYKGVTTRRFNV